MIHQDNGVGESIEKALEDLGKGNPPNSPITIVDGDRTILREERGDRVGVVGTPCGRVSGGEFSKLFGTHLVEVTRSATAGGVPTGQTDVAAPVADGHVTAVGAHRGITHVSRKHHVGCRSVVASGQRGGHRGDNLLHHRLGHRSVG